MVLLVAFWAYAQSWVYPSLALVLTQTSGGGGSNSPGIPWDRIISAGISPVIIVVLLLTGQFYVGRMIDKERENERGLWKLALDAERTRADKAEELLKASEAARDKLRDIAEDKFLPLLQNTTHTLERVYDFFMDRGDKG